MSHNNNDLALCVAHVLDRYFTDLDGEAPDALHEMVMRQVERPLLEYALRRSNGNQTQAAELLGITRNTLRRKIADYGLLAG
ncbi:MAG: Fis family transcriptional regulator [Uliginosibacterium sp.]|jgi:Fis family transcriptional regulator|nr:Fis family transcriptional regulator [Uliginosibacterium sp.]MBK9394413.1 Fis family transcriptional regulator [Uliginosibacterium sp.]MBK9617518.1 Fis family transcriptional regulator [Uliginosibacterium sp.]